MLRGSCPAAEPARRGLAWWGAAAAARGAGAGGSAAAWSGCLRASRGPLRGGRAVRGRRPFSVPEGGPRGGGDRAEALPACRFPPAALRPFRACPGPAVRLWAQPSREPARACGAGLARARVVRFATGSVRVVRGPSGKGGVKVYLGNRPFLMTALAGVRPLSGVSVEKLPEPSVHGLPHPAGEAARTRLSFSAV